MVTVPVPNVVARPTRGCSFVGWVVTALLASVVSVPVTAQEWTQFRGPDASGVVPDNSNLPERWSSTENIAWRTPVSGLAWSSPIVANGLVFVTAVVSEGNVEAPEGGWYGGGERDVPADVHHWMVYGLDLDTGEQRWATEVHAGVPQSSHHLKNTFGSETPVTDGERLYVLFGNVGLYALDFTGIVRWSRELPSARTRNGWGTASSPVLHDGRVYMVGDSEEQSYIAALSAETGGEVQAVDGGAAGGGVEPEEAASLVGGAGRWRVGFTPEETEEEGRPPPPSTWSPKNGGSGEVGGLPTPAPPSLSPSGGIRSTHSLRKQYQIFQVL